MNDPQPTGYLTAHLEGTKAGLGYSRSTYARKAWLTFGASFPSDRSASICEIGPGECELVEYLRDEAGYTNVQAVDISDEVIEQAAKFGIPAAYTSDTASWFSHQPSTFDCVVMLHVLEHVPKTDTINLLSAIRRSLTTSGRLLVEVPNMGDPLNGTYFRYGDFTHEVGFTEESLRYVLQQAGFDSIGFPESIGATSRSGRSAQRLARRILQACLFIVNLPNGRQMRRRIGPVLAAGRDAVTQSVLLSRLQARPTLVVGLGRLIAQAGFFVFAIAPAFVLPDASFNELAISVTMTLLVIVAPVGAIQLYLMRLDHADRHLVRFTTVSILLAAPLAAICLLLISAVSGLTATAVWIVIGGCANVIVTMSSSCLARGDSFIASAAVDGLTGPLLLAASLVLVATDQPASTWGEAYGATWVLAAIASFVVAQRVTRRDSPTPELASINLLGAWPMLTAGVLSQAFNRVDYLILTVVATENQAARYAIAARLVGPVLIALGSLNNSLYVQQIERQHRVAELVAVTRRTARRTLGLAAAWLIPTVLVVELLGLLSTSWADRDLLLPTGLLGIATVPFAWVIPWAFALNALHRERTWMAILAMATAANAAAVWAWGSGGASVCALIWLATQCGVAMSMGAVRGRSGLR